MEERFLFVVIFSHLDFFLIVGVHLGRFISHLFASIFLFSRDLPLAASRVWGGSRTGVVRRLFHQQKWEK